MPEPDQDRSGGRRGRTRRPARRPQVREAPQPVVATPGRPAAQPVFLIGVRADPLPAVIAAFPTLFTSASPTTGDLVHHYLGKPELSKVGSPDWLGYDGQGCSVYARLIYGARASIIVGICVTAAS